jgi:hypothetical protein
MSLAHVLAASAIAGVRDNVAIAALAAGSDALSAAPNRLVLEIEISERLPAGVSARRFPPT